MTLFLYPTTIGEPDSGSRTLVRQSSGPDSLVIWISSQTQQKYTVVYSGLIRSLLATSHTNPTGIGTSDSGPAESEAGLARNMDIFSNPTKVHGRVLWVNPFTISHFSHKSHWYWNVGRPESGYRGQYPPPRLDLGPDGRLASTQGIRISDWSQRVIYLTTEIYLTYHIEFPSLIGPYPSVYWSIHTPSPDYGFSHTNTSPVLHVYGFILHIPITITAYFTLQWVQNISPIHSTDSLIQLLYWWSLANSSSCVIQTIRTNLSFSTWTILHLIYVNTSSYIKTPTLDKAFPRCSLTAHT